jgi:serine/threonine protein kinase
MDLHCTRPNCSRPVNTFPDLDIANNPASVKSATQKYCSTCGMQLILVERYLPLRLLGQGGFGAAFLARDRYTPGMRRCVVKQFQPPHNLSPVQLKMAEELFEREAEALEDLGNAHPLIPDLFAFFELSVPGRQPDQHDRLFYLVQEYIDGQTMEEELGERGRFSSDAVLEVLREILQVLQFVHDNGSIHRDIKPSNIMRHRKNGGIYLLDFGAVRQVAKAGKYTGIYSEGYAPPEQVTGNMVFPSSDLYALAVTCIVLLTGKAPDELFDAHHNRWRWRQDASQVDARLADVLERMLLSTPSQRFQSALEALEALKSQSLRSLLAQSGFPANPPGAPSASSSSSAAPPASTPPPATPLPITSMPALSAIPPPMPPPPIPVTPAISASAAAPPGSLSASSAASSAASSGTPATPRPRTAPIAPFHLLELLASAGFTGFEGGLLAIALVSTLGTTLISGGFWLLLLAGLVFAQSRRLIERMDLPIIAGVTLGLVLFVEILRKILAASGNPLVVVLAIALGAGLIAICCTALFRLIYLLVHRLF